MLLTRQELLDRYELLNEQDCGHIELNGCHDWHIYYKDLYASIWLQGDQYGCTIWIRNKTEFDTGMTSADRYTVNKEGLFNILDRYLPKRKEIKLF